MKKLPLLREAIQPRLDGIQSNLTLLNEFAKLPFEKFQKAEVLDRVHHHLRLALEGVFNIAAHILSRVPGARETEYKRMARKLGEIGIVDNDFAQTVLVEMGGFRNRLTHFYAEIETEELYKICRENLGDIEKFLAAIKRLLEHPEKFELTLE